MGRRIEQVDAIRGVAALLIAVFYHNFSMGGQPLYSGPLDAWQPFAWLYRWGWTLVDLFFVISGFIFAHVYLNKDCSLKAGTTVGGFVWSRFARLYPLHLVTLAVCGVLVIIANWLGMPDYRSSSREAFVENLLFLQAWHGGFNNVSWSLSVEALCYALFIGIARAGMLRRIAPALVILGLSISLYATFDTLTGSIGRGLIGFFLGFHLWRWQDQLRTAPTWLLALIGVIGFLLPDWFIHYYVTLDFTAWPAALILALRLRCPLVLKWLGQRSYSIYLVHMPIYYGVHIIFGGARIPSPFDLAAQGIAAAAIIATADISYRKFETPMMAALRSGPRRSTHQRRFRPT